MAANRIIKVLVIIILAANICFAAESLMTITPKNISDNSVASGISFGNMYSSSYVNAQQYLEVVYKSTETYWYVNIFTNNTNASNSLIQRSGLICDQSDATRVPLMWRVYDDIQDIEEVEFIDTEKWAWLKDKGDKDDPGSPDNDESWNSAWRNKYTDVCAGSPFGDVLGTNPTEGRVGTSPVYIYLGAIFEGALPGKYETTLWFDIYHAADPRDIKPPVIEHTRIEDIHMLGNKMHIAADVRDNVNVASGDLYYRAIGQSTYTVKPLSVTPDENLIFHCYADIPKEEVTTPGVEYYFTVTDGFNSSIFTDDGYSDSIPAAVNPIQVKVDQRIVGSITLDGASLVLRDGNKNDGETFLAIPKRALKAATELTISQHEINDVPRGAGICISTQPVSVYKFEPAKLVFRKPVDMSLLYFDLDDDGLVELPDGTETEFQEEDLAIFWWDGFVWRLVGGAVDTKNNTVVAKVTHFTYYAVFPRRALTAADYRPAEKIITPATQDNINDFAQFNGLYGSFSIKIFDITGRLVIKIDENSSSGPRWDGVDSSGNIVESGVYIYQFRAMVDGSMQLISGTITVAK